MAERIKDTTPVKRINPGKTAKRITHAEFGDALNADMVAATPVNELDPISFFSIHQRMLAEIKSTGGRPSRLGVTGRRKVPMTDQEWHDLEDIATLLEQLGVKTSPGQVASFLLENSTQKLKTEIEEIEAEANSVLEAAAHANGPLEELKPVATELLRQMKIKRLERSLRELKTSKV